MLLTMLLPGLSSLLKAPVNRPDDQSRAIRENPPAVRHVQGLTDRETPQAITTITHDQIDDFRLNGIREALRAAPSITVERIETDRTELTSRGFNIDTFEYDGMGMPFARPCL
jgi:outer membrane receptor for ferric coprogen and ferric-rhodotorulic acid